MFDSTLFFSIYAALLAAFATMEIISVVFGAYLNKKNLQRQQAFEAEWAEKVANGEIPPGMNPMQMMMGGAPAPYFMPTVSGEKAPEPIPSGQYI